jgi:glyoxylase-like metal-dependent hydrolase (beta-lactamase superfamily II)
MRLILHGGFAEKGRTCVGVDHDGFRLLLDTGVKTSARGGADYYPAITPAELAATDAIVVTHAHEDHVGALGWCIAHGFSGRIYMTPETRRETANCLAGYGEPDDAQRLRGALIDTLPVGGSPLVLGPLAITSGRSGHIAGGAWCCLEGGGIRFAYCGDVVPASPMFAMDPLPAADAIAIDASYGDDDIPARERAAGIGAWVAARPEGCVLPTPLYGRSIELLAILPGPIALAPGMREALEQQLAQRDWLHPSGIGALRGRLESAADWHGGDEFPRAAVLCHDGMGLSGPSRDLLALARARRHPTLFTGHVPAHSPGAQMLADGLGDWIRLPTHPTLAENVAIAAASGARLVLGHSCERDALQRLARHLPGLRADLGTGDRVEL